MADNPPGVDEEIAKLRAAKARLRAFLAELHTGAECPRDPDDQFKAPGWWLRRLLLHVNAGKGVHIYRHEYKCIRCGTTTVVES